MKNQLDLNQMGLVEMNSNEMEEVEGGGLLGALLGMVVGAIAGAAISILGGEVSIKGTAATNIGQSMGIGALVGGSIGSELPF